jgi:hypothetical protein
MTSPYFTLTTLDVVLGVTVYITILVAWAYIAWLLLWRDTSPEDKARQRHKR